MSVPLASASGMDGMRGRGHYPGPFAFSDWLHQLPSFAGMMAWSL